LPKYKNVVKKRYLWYPCVYHKGKQYMPGPGFKKAEDASKRAIELKQELRKGLYIDDKTTIKELVIRYLSEYGRNNLEETTFKLEEGIFRNYIVKELGNIYLKDLNKYHIQMLKEKIIKHVSRCHANTVLKKLRKLLRFAVKWDLIRQNIAEKIDLPKIDRKEKERLTLEQFMFLITNEDIPIRDRCVMALAGCVGLRRGEVFALRWQDIDFINNQLYVENNFTGSIIKKVKSDKSHATLPMTEVLSNLLKKYRSDCGFSYWIFPSVLKSNDKPLTPGTWTEKIWKGILNHYRLPQVGIHSLRHFFATFLLSLNIPAPIVQRFMRHSRISTTVDVYGHLSTADLLKAVKLMDESLKPFYMEQTWNNDYIQKLNSL